MGLTKSGWWTLAVLLLLFVVSVFADNVLLRSLVMGLVVSFVVSGLLGAWNLRGLRVHRSLPDDLFAGHPSAGAFVVENSGDHRVRSVTVREQNHPFSGWAVRVSPGERLVLAVRWRFSQRGKHALEGVVFESDWPLGLWRFGRQQSSPVSVVVFPAIMGEQGHTPTWDRRSGNAAHGRGADDFIDLVAHRPADGVQRIHWPTTARVGHPMVVIRAAEQGLGVVVTISARDGEAWEDALARGCGSIVYWTRRSRAVGMRAWGREWPARTGVLWRRHLLEELALAPRRPT